MKDTQYLYDDNLSGLADLSYTHALKYKIGLCDRLVRNLQEVHYMQRDSARVNAVLAARKFNDTLLREVEIHKKHSR